MLRVFKKDPAHGERALLPRLEHYSIVRSYGVLEGEPAYLIMEYVPGHDANSRFFSLDERRKYGLDLLKALQHAHERGIVHSDVHGENFLISSSRGVLIDFGAAQSASPAMVAEDIRSAAELLYQMHTGYSWGDGGREDALTKELDAIVLCRGEDVRMKDLEAVLLNY